MKSSDGERKGRGGSGEGEDVGEEGGRDGVGRRGREAGGEGISDDEGVSARNEAEGGTATYLKESTKVLQGVDLVPVVGASNSGNLKIARLLLVVHCKRARSISTLFFLHSSATAHLGEHHNRSPRLSHHRGEALTPLTPLRKPSTGQQSPNQSNTTP